MRRVLAILLLRTSLVSLCLIGLAGDVTAGLSADLLYPRTGVREVELSPTGSWVAAIATRGRVNGVLVQRIGGGKTNPLIATEQHLMSVDWVGPRHPDRQLRCDVEAPDSGRSASLVQWKDDP